MINGIKIMNLEGSDILKNNIEKISINKEYSSVFANSLLLDKLKKTGLKVTKNTTTRDIINIKINYDYKSKEAKEIAIEITTIRNQIKENSSKIKELISNKLDKQLILNLKDNNKEDRLSIKTLEEKAKKLIMSKEAIRNRLYKNGFTLDFYKKDKVTKEYVIEKTIEYVMWFRTTSKSRVGEVMFINKELYNDIKTWQRMGLELPIEEAKIVEMSAYESLTSSCVEGYLEGIEPQKNILVVDDIESFFTTKCASVYVDESSECKVKYELNQVKNTLFDGQALLDDKCFINGYSDKSMLLLRQHFYKACCFRTNIELFMKEYCMTNNKDYNTYTVKDRYNNDIYVKDILMITTENAMKWEKFQYIGASYENWCNKVNEDGNIFGICKTDHSSKFKNNQRMSYQMISTLNINESETLELAKTSIEYVNKIKYDNEAYIEFLEQNCNEVNANQMIIDLYKQNRSFEKSSFFREYKKKDISKYVETLRNGKLLVEGDNLTVVGNPYVLLLHAVGHVPVLNGVLDKDFVDITLPVSNTVSDQNISVYTERFDEGEYLAAFRSPHNSPNNIGYHKNHKHEYMSKYFKFNNNIITVNLIQTEEQDLKNGLDMDSDFVFVTNNTTTVASAKKVFRNFSCIVNKIEKSTKTYKNTVENLALIDSNLAKSKYDIGLSSNLATLALSWHWNDNTQELADIVCIMSVLAQCAIDNSKRLYQVDIAKEIKRISQLDCMKHTTINTNNKAIKAKPYFWKYISSAVNEESLIECNCSMNHLQKALDTIKCASKENDTINTVEMIQLRTGKANDKQMKIIEKIIKGYDDKIKEHNDKVEKNIIVENKEKWNKQQQDLLNKVITDIKKLKILEKTMQTLITKAIDPASQSMNKKYKRKLLNALHKSHTASFLNCFKKAE
jgi:hypothetical protein